MRDRRRVAAKLSRALGADSALMEFTSTSVWAPLWRIFRAAWNDFRAQHGPTWAAAIAYYSLLSLFPFLLVAGSIASLFVDPEWAVLRVLHLFGEFLPKGQSAIEAIVRQTLHTARGLGFFFLLPTLWSASLVFGAVNEALNQTITGASQGSWAQRILKRLLMLGLVGGAFALALSSTLLLRWLQSGLGLLPVGRQWFFALSVNTLPASLLLLAFFLAFRFVPRRPTDWRAALFGSGVATLIFLAAKPLFLGYVHSFVRHNLVYGSLGGIIAFVIWIWVVAMIALYGGQLSVHAHAFLSHQSPDAFRKNS